MHLLIGEEAEGQRIDNWLFRLCKGVPKSHIYRILRGGEVRVNKKRVNAEYRLASGDNVRLPPMRTASRPSDIGALEAAGQAIKLDLPVVFEDSALLVVDKPSGVAVHGGSGVSFGVIEALRRQRPEARFLELAHRLDRETSGLLLIGKKRSALTSLHDMFRESRADKRYLALVRGRFMDPVRHFRQPLHKYLTKEGERRVRVSPEGKPSHTIVRLVARWEEYSLLECQIKTGRTHQIRVHLMDAGYPLLGDEKYGDFSLNKQMEKMGLRRMFLHAASLDFSHPLSREPLKLAAPLPLILLNFLRRLSREQKQDYGTTF